jgi:hypothetical protein
VKSWPNISTIDTENPSHGTNLPETDLPDSRQTANFFSINSSIVGLARRSPTAHVAIEAAPVAFVRQGALQLTDAQTTPTKLGTRSNECPFAPSCTKNPYLPHTSSRTLCSLDFRSLHTFCTLQVCFTPTTVHSSSRHREFNFSVERVCLGSEHYLSRCRSRTMWHPTENFVNNSPDQKSMSASPYHDDAAYEARGRPRLSRRALHSDYSDMENEDRIPKSERSNSAQHLQGATMRAGTQLVNDIEEYDLLSDEDVSGPSVSNPWGL